MENKKISEIIKNVNSAIYEGEENTKRDYGMSSRVYAELDDSSIMSDNVTYHKIHMNSDSRSCAIDSFMEGFEDKISRFGGSVIHTEDEYGFEDYGYEIIEHNIDDMSDIDDENDEDYYEASESDATIGVKIKWNSDIILEETK